MNPRGTYSFEFFPPVGEAQTAALYEAVDQLAALQPDFFSVTYGAGGGTRRHTLETVLELQRRTGVSGVPHISCIGSDRQQLGAVLDDFQAEGIRHVVALRGDLPSGLASPGEFRFATELVAFMRQHSGDYFHIEVAAYPEVHPQSMRLSDELQHFKLKVEAGANSAITQFFFNPDAYFRFIDACRQYGVDIPIVPGIMPITNCDRLVRFAGSCGAEIPRWLLYRLRDYGDDRKAIHDFGLEVVVDLCERLLQGGAPGLHIYTLNRARVSMQLCQALRARGLLSA